MIRVLDIGKLTQYTLSDIQNLKYKFNYCSKFATLAERRHLEGWTPGASMGPIRAIDGRLRLPLHKRVVFI